MLHVQSATVSAAGEVVNCGGYLVPSNSALSDWPMTPMPDPTERELTVTIRVPIPTPPEEHAAPPQRGGWLDRLMGR
jgi:hypothetical protein